MKEIMYGDGGTEQEMEQAVVVHVRLPGEGDDALRRKLQRELEESLAEADLGELDADSTSEQDGFCHYFVYGPSADEIARVLLPVLTADTLPQGSYMVKRYGDPGAEEERIDF